MPAIATDHQMLLKRLFWDVTRDPRTAMLGAAPVPPAVLKTPLTLDNVHLLLATSPPRAGDPRMSVVKLAVAASRSDPLTVGRLLGEIHRFYTQRAPSDEHLADYRAALAPGFQPPADPRYADLMDGQTLFMGLQFMATADAYYVHLLRRAGAGALTVIK